MLIVLKYIHVISHQQPLSILIKYNVIEKIYKHIQNKDFSTFELDFSHLILTPLSPKDD